MRYIVYLIYYSNNGKVVDKELETKILQLIKQHNGSVFSTGGGLGGRDMDIEFNNSNDVPNFISKVLKDPRIKIENIRESETEDKDE